MSARDKIAEILATSDHLDIEDYADRILAALPDMIAPLVWGTVSGVGRQTQYASGINGHYAIWSGYYRVPGIPKGIESEDPAADANAHHRAAIMAAFNGEAKT